MYRAVHISEVSSVVRKVANTEPTGSVFKSVRAAAESSHGTGVTSPARNAAGNESVVYGIADTDEEGDHSDLVIVRGTRVITGTVTNRNGVINDPVHIRDEHCDGTRDGRIGDADVGNGAERRADRRSRRRVGSRRRRDAQHRRHGVPVGLEKRRKAAS